MKPILKTLATIAIVVMAAACAGTSGRSPGPRPSLDTITREQIVEHRFTTAYDAVAALRSNWLTPRGTDSFQTPSEVLVYLDDVKLGGVDSMRGVNTLSVSFIKHYDGLSATQRWGVGHASGVILISTHPGPSRAS